MKLSRQSRLVTALIALVSVLFMQLALAAYACPTIQPAQAIELQASMDIAGHDGMDGCEGMVDTEQPALCHAHTHEGDQSLYKPATPDLSPIAAVVLVLAITNIDLAYRPVSTHALATWLMRSSAPPLSIRNCCFRI